jgi:hypothetical protein
MSVGDLFVCLFVEILANYIQCENVFMLCQRARAVQRTVNLSSATRCLTQCFTTFFLAGTLKISFHIPRNPLPMKTHLGQTNLIAESEIKLLLTYCQKFICKEFPYIPPYILKK